MSGEIEEIRRLLFAVRCNLISPVWSRLKTFGNRGKQRGLHCVRGLTLPWRKSIRIYRGGGLGDVLMCTPGVRELKAVNPRCHVTFSTKYPELLRGLSYMDEVCYCNQPPRDHIEMAYEGDGSPHGHLAKTMAARIGVRIRNVKPDCAVNPNLEVSFLSAWQDLPHPHILVQRRAGGWTPNKNWFDAYWDELLASLLHFGAVIEVGEEGTPRQVNNPEHYVDLRGKTGIPELVACVAAADMLVGPVSGPLHIAGALGKPAVIILGGYELPEFTAYPGQRTLYNPTDCSPCWLRDPCPRDRECLRQISPATVEQAIRDVWEQLQRELGGNVFAPGKRSIPPAA